MSQEFLEAYCARLEASLSRLVQASEPFTSLGFLPPTVAQLRRLEQALEEANETLSRGN